MSNAVRLIPVFPARRAFLRSRPPALFLSAR